jgi:hypothetical protein
MPFLFVSYTMLFTYVNIHKKLPEYCHYKINDADYNQKNAG